MQDSNPTHLQPPAILPPHYFVAFSALITGSHWLPGQHIFNTAVPLLGLLPMILGLVIAIQGSNLFKQADTNIVPLTKSSTLVVDGVFRFSRNPMYLGMLLFLTGLWVLTNRWWGLGLVLLFYILIRQLFVLREEALLATTFGDEYLNYKASVRRWF